MVIRLRPAGLAALVVLVATVMAGCANQDPAADGPLARQITAASQCGFAEPGLVYMDSRKRLAEVTSTRGMNLTAMDDHDFDREHLLLVAVGHKPTGGYGVALEDSRLEDGVLELTLTLRTPSADQIVTQALTSPCAVLAVTADHWDQMTVGGSGLPDLSLAR